MLSVAWEQRKTARVIYNADGPIAVFTGGYGNEAVAMLNASGYLQKVVTTNQGVEYIYLGWKPYRISTKNGHVIAVEDWSVLPPDEPHWSLQLHSGYMAIQGCIWSPSEAEAIRKVLNLFSGSFVQGKE
jgi:hypothetical protein